MPRADTLRIVVGVGLSEYRRPADAILIDFAFARIYVAGRLALQGNTGRGYAGPSRCFRAAALVLAASSAGAIEFDDLIEALWGDDPDGGPLAPRNVIYSMLAVPVYRRLFRRLGISIRSNYAGGLWILRAA